MLRNGDALFGVGLLLLWIGGLATGSTQWLTWFNFFASVAAFYIAAYGRDRAAGPGGTIGLSGTLFVASLMALSSGGTAWLAWATFAIACLTLLVGLSAFRRFDGDIPPRITRKRDMSAPTPR
jgi:hypothetical protein